VDELATVSVLNGEVQAGDRVAWATREGNGCAIHLGTVIELIPAARPWRPTMGPGFKVRIETETRLRPIPKQTRRVFELARVVKV
jgi:hypothetical protein